MQPCVPILSQIHPTQAFLTDFSHLRLGVPRYYFMYVSPTIPRMHFSSHPIPFTCRAHLVRLVFVNTGNIWCNVLCPRVISCLWCYSNIIRSEETRFVCRTLMTQIQTMSRDTGYFWLWTGWNVVVYMHKQDTCNYNIYCWLHVSGNTKLCMYADYE